MAAHWKWRTFEDVSREQKLATGAEEMSGKEGNFTRKYTEDEKRKKKFVLRMNDEDDVYWEGGVTWTWTKWMWYGTRNCRKTFSSLLLFTFHLHRTAASLLQFFLAASAISVSSIFSSSSKLRYLQYFHCYFNLEQLKRRRIFYVNWTSPRRLTKTFNCFVNKFETLIFTRFVDCRLRIWAFSSAVLGSLHVHIYEQKELSSFHAFWDFQI